MGYDTMLNGDVLKILWKPCCFNFMAAQETLPGKTGSLIYRKKQDWQWLWQANRKRGAVG
jgi:hypothetical protein